MTGFGYFFVISQVNAPPVSQIQYSFNLRITSKDRWYHIQGVLNAQRRPDRRSAQDIGPEQGHP